MPKPKVVRRESSSGRTNTKISIPLTEPKLVPSLPLHLQAKILSTFRNALLPTITATANAGSKDIKSIIQEVKSHLYNRDFTSAFGTEEYLDAYALRWSAGRALGYASVFLSSELRGIFENTSSRRQAGERSETGATSREVIQKKKIVCIGGGAGAEVVALAAVHQYLDDPNLEFDVHAVDIANWSNVIKKLDQAWDATSSRLEARNTSRPNTTGVSDTGNDKTADSTTTTTATGPLPSPLPPSPTDPSLSTQPRVTSFHHTNILTLPTPSLSTLLLPSSSTPCPPILTLLFTLNELFTTSLSQTIALLLHITDLVPPDTILLVIDSPGSYSEVSLGRGSSSTAIATADMNTKHHDDDNKNNNTKKEKEKKRYPMRFLLDHTLLTLSSSSSSSSSTSSATRVTPTTTTTTTTTLNAGGDGADPISTNKPKASCWEKFISQESRWFRIDQSSSSNQSSSRYPVELENMRFQMHAYRRL